MERNGVRLDVEACEAGRVRTAEKVQALEATLNEWAGQEINWGSWQQKRQFLYGTSVAPATKKGPPITPKGFDVPPVAGNLRAVKLAGDDEEPTSEAAIRYLADHVESAEDRSGLETLLEYSEASKLLTFYKTLPDHVGPDGRIHPQVGATTETGRLSCKNPNLQQQPPEVRDLFVSSPGSVLLALDYEGLEWRILAHVLVQMYGDTSLVEEIEKGIDPHSATAVRMNLCPGPVEEVKEKYPKERADAKILNYSINYGKTGAGLGVQIRGKDGSPIGRDAGQKLLDDFYKARPGIARFHTDIVKYAEGNGFVRSLLGRRRYIPELRSSVRGIYRKGTRLAKNVIQNCATDVVTLAMLKTCPVRHPEVMGLPWFDLDAVRTLEGWGVKALLQVHDELVFEVPEKHAERAKETLSDLMVTCLEGVREFKCPLGVSGGIGPNWRAAGGK